jgi:hypothetical protein
MCTKVKAPRSGKSNRGWKGRLQIFFSNLSIFEIEKCFMHLFGSLGLQFLLAKNVLENF